MQPLSNRTNTFTDSVIRRMTRIAIDCGACFPGGRLAAICLETGEEFYSSDNNG